MGWIIAALTDQRPIATQCYKAQGLEAQRERSRTPFEKSSRRLQSNGVWDVLKVSMSTEYPWTPHSGPCQLHLVKIHLFVFDSWHFPWNLYSIYGSLDICKGNILRLSRIPKLTSAQLYRLNIRLAHSLAKEHMSHIAALTCVFTLTGRKQNG